MENKKVLVTGGAGYIGSHAALHYLKEGYRVVVLDNLSRGFLKTIDELGNNGDLKFFKIDLVDGEALRKLFLEEKDFDCVLHFAALCSVDESVRDPEIYYLNNVVGSANLLKEVRKNGIKKVVFSSTCAVYGESQYLPINEEHPTNPTNPYGETKLVVEKLISEYSRSYGIKSVILRYFNVCGASEEGVIGDAKNPSPHLMQNAVLGALGIKPFKLTYSEVDTPDGSPIRDYLDILDLIRAHYLAQRYLEEMEGTYTFNVGTGRGNSVLEIVRKVEEVTNTRLPREVGDKREGEYTAVYADYKKAKEDLGWEPERTLEESVRTLVTWYKKLYEQDL
jgi:UDP-glucose 4-epimerase